MTDTNLQDETLILIERCLKGDQTAFSELYDLYVAGVYRLCYGLVLNREDAEDVMQESFVYAFKNLRRYNSELSAFKTWLYTITVSRCRNVYRRKRPQLIGLSQLFQLNVAMPAESSPEAFATRNAIKEAIATSLAELTPILREAVILRYGHGLTYREIAEVMDCPQKTAESRVRLAHDRLRGLLSGEGQSLLQELLSY